MLVLSRKCGQRLSIGDNITVTVSAIRSNRVRLTFDAPPSVSIARHEVLQRAAQIASSLANRP